MKALLLLVYSLLSLKRTISNSHTKFSKWENVDEYFIDLGDDEKLSKPKSNGRSTKTKSISLAQFLPMKASKYKRCMKTWGNIWNKYYKVLEASMYKEQSQLNKKYAP